MLTIRTASISRSQRPRRNRPWLEALETRLTPCNGLSQIFSAAGMALGGQDDYHAAIVAGDPNGSPPDSPSLRVDPNTTTSPYAGVGSLQINTRRGTYICTATPIGSRHILTAGHCVDINNDGRVNNKDGIRSIYFILNYGGSATHIIQVSSISIHPNYTGFARPSVNDDIAVLTLASPLPPGVPIYGLPSSDLLAGTTITLVGYGQSGTGTQGYTVGASFTAKRVGENNADAFYGQDDAGQPAANEVFRFDFDGPSGNGTFGGPTLGNNRETTLGGGDSGGPSFVGNVIVGVNTFTQGFSAPLFGSLGGGINVFPYVGFINLVMSGSASAPAPAPNGERVGNEEAPGPSTGEFPLSDPGADLVVQQAVIAGLVELAAPDSSDLPVTFLAAANQPAPAMTPQLVNPSAAITRTIPALSVLQSGTSQPDGWFLRLGVLEGLDAQAVLARATAPDKGTPPAPASPAAPTSGKDASRQAWLRAWETLVDDDESDFLRSEREAVYTDTTQAVPGPVFHSSAAAVGLMILSGSYYRGLVPADEREPRRRWLIW